MKQNRKCVKDCYDRNPNISYQIKEDIDCGSLREKTSHTCQVEEWIILRSTSYLQWFKTWIIPPNLKEWEGPSGEWTDCGVWYSTQKQVVLKHRPGTFAGGWFLFYFCFYSDSDEDPTPPNAGTILRVLPAPQAIGFSPNRIWISVTRAHALCSTNVKQGKALSSLIPQFNETLVKISKTLRGRKTS